jgi:regulator of protease activity HflC (stomatin/prohibitin superfamily)
MNVLIIVVVVVVVLFLLGMALSARIVKQYEEGVLFRLGRVQGPRKPGFRLIIPLVDVLRRVSLRIVTMPIQSQGIITHDNVSVDVSAVAYFRVVDAVKSVVAIENVGTAIDQIAQTTLRKVVGQHTLDQTLSAAALGQASDIMAAASPPPFITAGPIPPPTAAANGTDAS